MTVIHLNLGADAEDSRDLLERGVRAALAEEGVKGGELSLTIVGDAEIRELSATYLGRDHTTDVISFSLHGRGEPVLADIYVGGEEARRQAREFGIPLREELLRLAVHGTLHVLGYDHPAGSEREKSELFRKQERLVRRIVKER